MLAYIIVLLLVLIYLYTRQASEIELNPYLTDADFYIRGPNGKYAKPDFTASGDPIMRFGDQRFSFKLIPVAHNDLRVHIFATAAAFGPIKIMQMFRTNEIPYIQVQTERGYISSDDSGYSKYSSRATKFFIEYI